MRSAIPVALLCQIVYIRMSGSRAAAPKGTKSCRTQGDFRLSVRLFVHLRLDGVDLRLEQAI